MSKNSRAFTLLEVSITIFVVALIVLVFSSIQSRWSDKIILKMEEEKIVALTEKAKSTAQAHSADVLILFSGETVNLEQDGLTIDTLILPKHYTCSIQKLGFTPAGTPKYAGTVNLSYQNQLLAKFILPPATGLYRWENQ